PPSSRCRSSFCPLMRKATSTFAGFNPYCARSDGFSSTTLLTSRVARLVAAFDTCPWSASVFSGSTSCHAPFVFSARAASPVAGLSWISSIWSASTANTFAFVGAASDAGFLRSTKKMYATRPMRTTTSTMVDFSPLTSAFPPPRKDTGAEDQRRHHEERHPEDRGGLPRRDRQMAVARRLRPD